ncbi:hypothetical protein D3C79_457130 [compost metagenome]
MTRSQQTASHRHLLQLDQIFPRPDPLVEAQMDAGERHPEIEIECPSYPHQFFIEGYRLQIGLQGGIHIDQQGHRHGKLLLLAELASGLAARFGLAARRWRAGPLSQHSRQVLTVAALLLALAQPDKIAARRHHGGQGEEGHHGEARYQAEQQQQHATDQQRLGLGHHLGANVGTQVG